MLALLTLAWLACDGLVVAPGFGGTDIYYFKDAAVNFAEGHGLVTRFTFGNPLFVYRDYAMYPPLYPFAFGIWARVFGISLLSNHLFNVGLMTMTGVVMFFVLRRLVNAEGRMGSSSDARSRGGVAMAIAVLLFVAAIMTGCFLPPDDRPDGLGVLLGVAALMLSSDLVSGGRAVLAGGTAVITLFTSPFAGVWTGLALLAGTACTSDWSVAGLRQAMQRLLLLGLGAAIVAGAALLLLKAYLPGWFAAFFGVASGAQTHNETGGGYFLALLHGDFRTWVGAFPLTLSSFYFGLGKLLAVEVALIAWMVFDRIRRRAAATAWRLTPLALLGPLCLVTSPYQSNYVPMSAALLLAAWAAYAPGLPREAAPAIVGDVVGPKDYPASPFALVCFAVMGILGLPFVARDLVLRSSAAASIGRARAYIVEHRPELTAAGTFVAVSPTTYMLWRQEGIRPLISTYSGFNDATNRAHALHVALAYPGSSDDRAPQLPPWVQHSEYQSVYKPVLPQLALLFGYRASHSSQTWESEILRRRPRPELVSR